MSPMAWATILAPIAALLITEAFDEPRWVGAVIAIFGAVLLILWIRTWLHDSRSWRRPIHTWVILFVLTVVTPLAYYIYGLVVGIVWIAAIVCAVQSSLMSTGHSQPDGDG